MATAPLAIIVAMDKELVHLVGDLAARSPDIGGRPRYDMEIAGLPAVAVRCGVGMLDAAATTERVIAELGPMAVLNFGCAGAHRPDVLLGDVVIAERTVYTAALTILRDGTERHVGFAHPDLDEPAGHADLPADPAWLAAAVEASGRHTVAPWPDDLAWHPGVPRRPAKVHRGAAASADIWTQEIAKIASLSERHGSLCEDMEAAAIAHVAAVHGVPFLSVKDISNNELHAATDLDEFADFPSGEVGRRAAALLTATIETWAASRPST